ncbi:MAG: glycosyltransferase family 1 protein [Caldilineae bacterium]|nr:MAG: glycosyltransferase family 1 protein [Caldilineae bacterium]
MQRVAMLSVHTCPLAMLGGKETGGMNVYVKELTTELDRRGITVDVFTRSQEPGTPVVHGVLGERSRVIHVPAGPERPYNKNKVYDHLPEFVEHVRARAIRENLQYDILHSHYWLSGLAARSLRCIWGGTPIIQMFHTLGEMKNRIAQTPAERETPLRIRSERDIVHFADRLIAATPVEKNDLTTLYDADPAKIDIIPPGVNLRLFRPLPRDEALRKIGVPQGHKMILFVGRIQPLKGIDSLIRAMALVLRRYPELKNHLCISIIGGDPNPDSELEQAELERLHALKEELGIGDLVTFLGAKDQNTLAHYYSAAQMVVMPSHYESFGMVAIEAMACATPVIASDVGGLTYTVEDGFNGYLVPRKDHAALADKIGLLLRYPRLRDQLGEQAHRWVERFSWAHIADEILTVYQKTVQEKYQPVCI